MEANKAVRILLYHDFARRLWHYLGRYSDLVCRTKQLLTIARALLKDTALDFG